MLRIRHFVVALAVVFVVAVCTAEVGVPSIYKSPYVFLGCKTHCGSGCIAEYDGHVFVLTAAHLFKLGQEETKLLRVYDADKQPLGYAVPAYLDLDRDIAVAFVSFDKLADRYIRIGSFQVSKMSYSELRDAVGDDATFYGACGVGDWLDIGSCSPFQEKVTIARVHKGKLPSLEKPTTDKAAKESILITVKGGGWFGCSGGPLVYRGKVIGVCSVLENWPSSNPKTGTVYVNPLATLREWQAELKKCHRDH